MVFILTNKFQITFPDRTFPDRTDLVRVITRTKQGTRRHPRTRAKLRKLEKQNLQRTKTTADSDFCVAHFISPEETAETR